jgi:putative hemolysin
MRYLLLALMLPLAACTTATPPDAPKPPQVGMANPASVYCLEKGGNRSRFKARRAYVRSANYRAAK